VATPLPGRRGKPAGLPHLFRKFLLRNNLINDDARFKASDFALAPALTFRNLSIMRKLWFIFALLCALSVVSHAADKQSLATNTISAGKEGTLEILTPPGWTLLQTNLNLPDKPLTAELHSPSEQTVIRVYLRWDNFGGTTIKPNDKNMEQIVSNTVARQYLSMSVEKSITLEKLRGPGVTGVFARITDAGWTPVMKNEFPNLTEGMFRCENLWGNFNLMSFGKNSPSFKEGLKVLESMRRKP
jgi:hypothetical protein